MADLLSALTHLPRPQFVEDGIPLDRLDIDQVCRCADAGTPVTDPVTQNYIALAEWVPGNELYALLALAEGMRDSPSTPTPTPLTRRSSRCCSRPGRRTA